MQIKDESFRNLYRSFIIVKSKEDAERQEQLFNIDSIDFDSIETELHNIPIENEVNAMLLYPYIDHTAGMSFLVVATALLMDSEKAKIYNRKSFESLITIRKDAMNEKEFIYAENLMINNDFELEKHVEYANEITESYRKDLKLEAFRMLDLIDESRENDYPDDILVYFYREGFNIEGMWVRGEELNEGYITGTLLNQPNQDFGISSGDKVKVILQEDGDDKIICVADLR